MAKLVMDHKELFQTGHNMRTVRHKLDWMDAVTYEDIHKLYVTDNLSEQSIKNIL